MVRKKAKSLIIFECFPKCEGDKEGEVLYNLLDMIGDSELDEMYLWEISSRKQLLNRLKRKDSIKRYDYIHLSGHGDIDRNVFETPKGVLAPEDFPKDCFEGKTVTFSSCEIGRTKFAEPFRKHTGARYVIAPRNEVSTIDSAFWFVSFYFWVLEKKVRPDTAYDRTDDYIKGRDVKGGFGIWGDFKD